MAGVGLALLFLPVLGWFALRANARFVDQDRLPMQWWFTGEVTWSAPRPLALLFIPMLAVVVLGMQVVLALTMAPRPGQENLVLPILMGTGAVFVAIQLLHIRLIDWTLRRDDR